MKSDVLAVLTSTAGTADLQTAWPTASWQALAGSGALGLSIPSAFGGNERDAAELLEVYFELAGSCLTTTFILSQREAAVRRIVDSGNDQLCRELLRPLACGGRFATVGLSQLTTSRQHGAPALRATLEQDALVLDGVIPWVTGAAEAQHIIIGAVLEDGKQVLAVLPTDLPGVAVGEPLDLMALRGSLTAEVRCDHVVVDRRWLLAGPAERVMNVGRGGTGGLETSCLALGLANAAVAHLKQESAARPELDVTVAGLDHSLQSLRTTMHELASVGASPEATATLRGKANQLVLQATQAALTASKGAGFLMSHPAQRWARQALFFLVWSCPRPATEATLAYLTPAGTCDLLGG